MKLPCEIIRDLLPLYQDGVCGTQSAQAVEAHLPECPACAEALEVMRAEVRMPPPATPEDLSAGDAMRALARRWRRSKVMMGISCAVLAIVLYAFGSWVYVKLFLEDTVPIPTAQIEEAVWYRAESDDSLSFHLRIKDGKAPVGSCWQMAYFANEDGITDEYMVTLRPRIPLGRDPNAMSGGSGFLTEDMEGTRFYYGTPEDHILLWEPGMELTVLTEEEMRQRYPTLFRDAI